MSLYGPVTEVYLGSGWPLQRVDVPVSWVHISIEVLALCDPQEDSRCLKFADRRQLLNGLSLDQEAALIPRSSGDYVAVSRVDTPLES
jgi:hypothetical protein